MSDDEDLDWEEWLELSDEQQEAICDREMAEYYKMLDRMPLKQRIDHARGNALRSCLNWRRMINCHGFTFGRTYLRDAQVRLLKLRIWRATGQYPGEA